MATKSLQLLLFVCTALSIEYSTLIDAYDYLKLVQQWPQSTCNYRSGPCLPLNANLPVNFTIHGMWPDNFWGGHPYYCNKRLKLKRFQPAYLVRLKNSWPNIENQTDHVTFWRRQWLKHGTCSVAVLNQQNYFDSALYWKDRFDLLKLLGQNGIHPGVQHRYQISLINSTIMAATNRVPDLRCNMISWGPLHVQLHEIGICLDKNARTVIDCPSSRRSFSCRNAINFP